MHLTLKREATKPAAANVLQQQARFDDFVTRFNRDRPHQALGMKVPAELYTRSAQAYRGLQELTYPFHDQTIAVTQCGRICCFVAQDGVGSGLLFRPQLALKRHLQRTAVVAFVANAHADAKLGEQLPNVIEAPAR
jgi:hypothetical protein